MSDMKFVDSMVLFNRCKNKIYEPVCFCDMSMFETLKHKTEEERLKHFIDLDNFVKQSKSIMYVRNSKINVFDNREVEERYKDAVRISKECAYIVGKSFLDVCLIIYILLMIKKGIKNLKPGGKEKYEEAINGVIIVANDISIEMKDELISYIFDKFPDKTKRTKLFKELLNTFIKRTNDFLNIDELKLKEITSFTANGISVENDLKFDDEFIDKYFDSLVSFKTNNDITKKVYKKYIKNVLEVSGKIETNDIADMHIFFAAYANGFELTSDDKKTKKLLSYFK